MSISFKLYFIILLKDIYISLQVFVLSFFQFIYKQKQYILFDNLYEADAECIDAYTLFKYMQKKNIKSTYIILKDNFLYQKLLTENKLINILPIDSLEKLIINNIKLFATSKVVLAGFPANSIINKILFKNKKIKYIFLNHGLTFLKKFAMDWWNPQLFNYMIINCNFEKKLFIEEVNWDEKKLISAGMPRWDNLKKRNEVQKSIFMMFTWRRTLNNDSFLYSNYFKKIKSLLQNTKFNDLLKKSNIILNFAVHHYNTNIKCFYNLVQNNSNIRFINCTEISKFISSSSLFITDISSLAFDFMYINIPVIFYKIDYEGSDQRYLKEESLLYAKKKYKYLYNCVYNEYDFLKVLEKYINNNFELEEENIIKNNTFFDLTDRGNICKHLVEKIQKL